MSQNMQYTFRCTIHDFDFGHGQLPKGHEVAMCPLCAWQRAKLAEGQRDEAVRQRDALLDAIEIKQTVKATTPKGQP